MDLVSLLPFGANCDILRKFWKTHVLWNMFSFWFHSLRSLMFMLALKEDVSAKPPNYYPFNYKRNLFKLYTLRVIFDFFPKNKIERWNISNMLIVIDYEYLSEDLSDIPQSIFYFGETAVVRKWHIEWDNCIVISNHVEIRARASCGALSLDSLV